MAGVKQKPSGHFHRAYFDDIHLRQGERYNCLLRYGLYTKHNNHTSRTAAKIRLPTIQLPKVFLKKFPKAVLTNCVVHHRHLMEVILMIFFFKWKSPNSQGLKATLGEGYSYDYHQGP